MKYIYILFFLILFNGLAESKIINGNDVNSLDYPWMVSLVNHDIYPENYCGGALIASKWAVTSAHCLHRSSCGYPFDLNKIEVLLGTYDLKNPGMKLSVVNSVVYPDYNCAAGDSDIALIELSTDVNLPTIGLVSSIFSDTEVVTTMGWGITGFETRPDLPGWKKPLYSDILQELSLNTLANDECEKVYPGWITDNMICAISEEGKAPCVFDSGGPLIIKQDGDWVLAGILSWGTDIDCAVPGYPDVFTRVSEFRDFIYKHIGYPDMPYDYNGDQKIGLEDAVFVIRSIVVDENSTDLSAVIEILQIMSGSAEGGES